MDLRQTLLEEKRRRGFISLAGIERLITPENVAAQLALRDLRPGPSSVFTIASTARKLFAILVLLELEHHAPNLIRERISDRLFPIHDKADIPLFETESQRQAFFTEQWTIPPRFDRDKHLECPTATVLPFLEKERVNNGTFGILYRVKVADGHLHGYSSVPPTSQRP